MARGSTLATAASGCPDGADGPVMGVDWAGEQARQAAVWGGGGQGWISVAQLCATSLISYVHNKLCYVASKKQHFLSDLQLVINTETDFEYVHSIQ